MGGMPGGGGGGGMGLEGGGVGGGVNCKGGVGRDGWCGVRVRGRSGGGGGSGGISKKGGGGSTTYSGAICIANKQNHLKKGGVRTPWTPSPPPPPPPLDLPGVGRVEWVGVG